MKRRRRRKWERGDEERHFERTKVHQTESRNGERRTTTQVLKQHTRNLYTSPKLIPPPSCHQNITTTNFPSCWEKEFYQYHVLFRLGTFIINWWCIRMPAKETKNSKKRWQKRTSAKRWVLIITVREWKYIVFVGSFRRSDYRSECSFDYSTPFGSVGILRFLIADLGGTEIIKRWMWETRPVWVLISIDRLLVFLLEALLFCERMVNRVTSPLPPVRSPLINKIPQHTASVLHKYTSQMVDSGRGNSRFTL